MGGTGSAVGVQPFTGLVWAPWWPAPRRLCGRPWRRRSGVRPGAEHGEDEQDAGDDDLRLGGDVLQAHDVLQGAEQEHAGDRAAERSLAAVEVDTAEQYGGDDREFEAGGVVVAGAGVVQGPEDAGEGGHQTGHREEDQLLPLDPDAGEPGGLLARSGREDRAAEGGGVQGDHGDHEQDQEGDEGLRDEAVTDPAGREVQVLGGEVGDRVGAEDDLRDAPVGGEGADGDGEGGQAEPGDQQAVDQSADHTEGQTDRDDRLDGHALVPQGAHHRAGETGGGGDRQVDLAGDHEEGHREGDQRDRQGVADEEGQVERVAEAVDGGEGQQEHGDEEGTDGGIPPFQGGPAHSTRQRGVSHGGRSSSSGRSPPGPRPRGPRRWRG